MEGSWEITLSLCQYAGEQPLCCHIFCYLSKKLTFKSNGLSYLESRSMDMYGICILNAKLAIPMPPSSLFPKDFPRDHMELEKKEILRNLPCQPATSS